METSSNCCCPGQQQQETTKGVFFVWQNQQLLFVVVAGDYGVSAVEMIEISFCIESKECVILFQWPPECVVAALAAKCVWYLHRNTM